jgi:voltage-gated potassium channel Kch
MARPSAGQRLHYAFDNSLAKGPLMLIAWLALASAGFIALMAALVWLAGLSPAADDGTRPGFVQIAWSSLMRTLDAGTMGGDQGSWPFLISMLVVTLGGVFIISILIGTISSGIEEKVEALKKGRSRVIESGHTLILGWSPQVFTLVSEISTANANKPGSCIVVMGEEDKEKMQDEIRERVPAGRTRVVCRTGSPSDLTDLEMASVQTARAIVILPAEGPGSDAAVIKSLLAITNHPRRRPEPYHIVTAIHDPRNIDVAKLVGKDEAEIVLVGDLLSRVTVQTCRQAGLSVVYLELLDFGGDEIYFQEEPKLLGKTFGDAVLAYEDSAIIGIRPRTGGTLLNPPMDRKIEAGDKVIAISEDDDTVRVNAGSPAVDAAAIVARTPPPAPPERTLILGWNWRVTRILRELNAYVAAGSIATVFAEHEAGADEIARECGSLERLAVDYKAGDTTDRALLDSLNVPSYDHVILLCDETREVEDSDARVLMTLLHLRDIHDKSGKDFSIVSEMMDVRNRELADVTRADDFIVGARLVSLLLAQVAENKELNALFADIFDPDGSEIYLKPAASYITLGRPVDFYTVAESARRRGEAAIGYRIKAQAGDPERAYGVKVNPKKSEKVTFTEADKIIVVAEN